MVPQRTDPLWGELHHTQHHHGITASNAGEYNCTVSNEAGSDGDVSTLIGEEGVSVQVVMCPRRLVRGVGGYKW